MPHAPVAPSLDVDVHLVLCRFGRAGLAYVETDPTEADATTVVRNLLYGQYGEPLRVVALNVEEGWSRDVSEAIAHKVLQIARQDDVELTDGTLAFIEAHIEAALQPSLPLWEAADAALRAEIGCDACDEEIERAEKAQFKIEGEIVRTPATTMEGLRIKARLALSVSGVLQNLRQRPTFVGDDAPDVEDVVHELAWDILDMHSLGKR